MGIVVLSGGTIFDGKATQGTADVAIRDGRIVDVGVGLDGDEQIDVSGRTVFPGFIDCHVHVVLSRVDALHNMQLPFSYQFFQAAENLSTLLDIGITTIRDAHGADLGIKQAVEDGLIRGPRMQISVAMLSQTGGHGDDWMPCGGRMSMFSAAHPGRPKAVVDGPDEMRAKVREIVRSGADVIKVATSGGVLSPHSDPRHRHFGDQELAVLMSEAAAADRPVMAHAQATDGIKAALRAGVRSIEHGIFLDEEAIELMLAQGTWLVPTLLAPHGLLEAVDSGWVTLAQHAVDKLREVVTAHVDSFRRAVDAGVRVAMGTDCPASPHGTNLRELELMTKLSSMSSDQALATATSSAAGLLRLDREVGEIKPGQRADLVVAEGSAADLSDLGGRIRQVWKDGILVTVATETATTESR